MKKQIVIATVAGALVAGAGLLWTRPPFSATSDVQVVADWEAVTVQGEAYPAR